MLLVEIISWFVFVWFGLALPLLQFVIDFTVASGAAMAFGVTVLAGAIAFAMPPRSSLGTLMTLTAAAWFNIGLVYILTSVTTGNLVSLMCSWLLLFTAVSYPMQTGVNRPLSIDTIE